MLIRQYKMNISIEDSESHFITNPTGFYLGFVLHFKSRDHQRRMRAKLLGIATPFLCPNKYCLEKSRRDEVSSVFLSPAEKNGFPFVL